ncbi:MAG: DUF2243 domain-containing protein [Beijerinckiaceae bacterium]
MDGREQAAFPVSAGVLLGLGLGGFFDGIVLHQILQWHHMATSAGYPADSVENMRFNVMLDGLFHAATWLFTVAGVVILWVRSRRTHVRWAGSELPASMLIGFGAFNLAEGLINHQILGLHHVNETAPRDQWIYWDVGFLISGALLLLIGFIMLRRARPARADA